MNADNSRLYASAILVLAGGVTLGLGSAAPAEGAGPVAVLCGGITWLVGSILFLREYRRPDGPPQ